MPAGAAGAPRAVPVGFAGFGGFPEDEVGGVGFVRIYLYASACLQVVDIFFGEFAVVIGFWGAKIDGAVHIVGEAFVDKVLDKGDDVGDFLGNPGEMGGWANVETLHIGEKFVDIGVGDVQKTHALLVSSFDDFVINICKILYEIDIVASIFQKAVENVKDHMGAKIAYVGKIVNRGAADVNAGFAGVDGNEGPFCTGKCAI